MAGSRTITTGCRLASQERATRSPPSEVACRAGAWAATPSSAARTETAGRPGTASRTAASRAASSAGSGTANAKCSLPCLSSATRLAAKLR